MKSIALPIIFSIVGILGLFLSPTFVQSAADLDYSVSDPELKVVRIDSAPTESFLAVRADGLGRLFVGGREELFVYEPNPQGGYRPRQSLMKFPNHTWVYDIEIRGHDLYVMTVSALYLIPDGVVKREGLQIKRLIWGVPMGHVHQCFHALAWGPEGDLYLSMGDPVTNYGDFNRPDHWMHWTFFSQPEGTKTPYTGVGGVFRCRPDGSRFQVVARGLRNCCGLTFDRHWNLFSNDNDHESIPASYVPGRLNHVTPFADFSWPRGWMLQKTPDRADLLATMTTNLGRFVPVLQAYYDDDFLPEKYRNNLLVARWCTRSVPRYPLKPRGASFQTEEQPLLVGRNNARPVGVSVGRGGRVFVTISYMAHNDASPVYQSDLAMITRKDDPAAAPFGAYEAVIAPASKLWSELSQASWSRRDRAHQEILRRGGDLLGEALRRFDGADAKQLDRSHLLWLAAALRTDASEALLEKAANNLDENLRLQAIRALNEYSRSPRRFEIFQKALIDRNPQVQLAGVVGLFGCDGKLPAALIEGPARSNDSYLRQTATLLLAEKGSIEECAELCRSADTATRLAGVLAIGAKLTLPPSTQPLPAEMPLESIRSAEAYVIQFVDAKLDLRQFGRLGHFTLAEHWKAGKHTQMQEKLYALLLPRLSDDSEAVRLQAAHFLYLLNDPRSEPLVAKVRRAVENQRLATAPIKAINKAWITGPFPDSAAMFEAIHDPERGAVDVAAEYSTKADKRSWQEMNATRLFDLGKQFGNCDQSSFYAYCRLESGTNQRIQLLVGSDDGVKAWINGRPIFVNATVRAALPFQDVIPVELQAGSNDLLVRVHNVNGDCGLYLHYRALGNVMVTIPPKLGLDTLAERLKNAGPNQAEIAPEFLKTDWSKAVTAGDAKKGRQLFGTLGCVKCHGITADAAVTGGPSLAESNKRFTIPYLVESILTPNKQVSPVFRATLVTTSKGQQFSGLVVGDNADKVELLLADANRIASSRVRSPNDDCKTSRRCRPGLSKHLRSCATCWRTS